MMSLRQCAGAGSIVTLLGLLIGCMTSPPQSTVLARVADAAAPAASAPLTGSADGNCERLVSLSNGESICIDELAALLARAATSDMDGDTDLDAADPDLDGDGVLNSYDADVDQDGVTNALDRDVDGDGLPNDRDPDIDGDFIRNRWDLDVDGDFVYDAFDSDSDGDGLLDLLQHRVRGGFDERDPNDNAINDSDNANLNSNDNGPANVVNPAAVPPDSAQSQAIDQQNAALLGAPIAVAEAIREQVTSIATDATMDEYLDGLHALFEDALADATPTQPVERPVAIAVAPASVREAVPQRIDAAEALATIGGASLPVLVAAVDTAAEVATESNATLADVVATARAIDDSEPTTNLAQSVERAAELHRVAAGNDVAPAVVASLVEPLTATSRTLRGAPTESDTVGVFVAVASLLSEFRNEAGESPFSVLSVARAVDEIAARADSPTQEAVIASARNILTASAAREPPLDPLAVVERLADADADASDGVSEEEASAAAEAAEPAE
ncbi:MAG: hypothetical protein SF069_18855 [Phycisphaerae bacterium]|nr:hypothetical protein [Phycisphaerae bacterium]